MRKTLVLAALCCLSLQLAAETIPFADGRLTVTKVAKNAVRIQYAVGDNKSDLPDWLYVKHDEGSSPT